MIQLAAESLLGSRLGADPEFAQSLDEEDPLSAFRNRFQLPRGRDGQPLVYLVGNSLGPLPIDARKALRAEIDRWAQLGVDGWFESPGDWYTADERPLPALATIVGAMPHEIAILNGLTVNLHLLLASFYRPDGERRQVLIDGPCFPSDRYAAETQIRWHGLDPAVDLVEVGPAQGHTLVTEADIEERLAAEGSKIALVLLSGVNYHTGLRLDIPRIARAAHAAGAVVGLDLAHAVGNVPLSLHDWDVDFAVWCHYKYINAGPGAPGGIFVHERHGEGGELGRLGGWWGNDPKTRFRLHLEPAFIPRGGAVGWQVSTPSVLALAPLGPALSLFAEAGMQALRARSVSLTAYLEWLLERTVGDTVELLTPRDPDRRGAQLSLRIARDARRVQQALKEEGVIGDFREPDVLRLAPAPLFNTYGELWRTSDALKRALHSSVTAGGRR